jgi:hypothetical protein
VQVSGEASKNDQFAARVDVHAEIGAACKEEEQEHAARLGLGGQLGSERWHDRIEARLEKDGAANGRHSKGENGPSGMLLVLGTPNVPNTATGDTDVPQSQVQASEASG